MNGLFPSLLGATFEQLAPPVRYVHGGGSRRLLGTASIGRGSSLVARGLCALASLPRWSPEVSVEVHIATNGSSESWSRHFGDSPPMRSTLRAREDTLLERLGPAEFAFHLRARDGGIEWSLASVSTLGIPLPRRWFTVSAYSGARADHYRFVVDVALLELRGPWILFGAARIIPRPWRDALYRVLARNRYRWFGKRDTCYLPP